MRKVRVLSWAFLLLLYALHAIAEPPVLRISLDHEPATLDWNRYRTPADRFLVSFMMRGLLKYDLTGVPVCDLCKSFSITADGKTLSFEINVQESWSDGVKLEASHFVDSFRRLLDPKFPSPHARDFPKGMNVKAASKDRLIIELSEPAPLLPHLLTSVSCFPIRKEFVTSGGNGVSMVSRAVLGPYQLAEWEKGRRLVIEGNSKFTGARPVYRVDFVLGAHQELLGKFRSGRIDILTGPTTEDLLNLPQKNVQVSPAWNVRILGFNFKRPLPSQRSLRAAILYALDRESLPSVMKTGERKTTGLIPPGMSGYRELPLATFDLAQALRERDGVKSPAPQGQGIDLTLLVRNHGTDRAMTRWLADRLAQVRIRLKPLEVSDSGFLAAYQKGGYDLALLNWPFTLASPVDLLRTLQTHSPLNVMGWTHVGFDALFGQLLREQRSNESLKLLDQMTQIAEIQEVALIPLAYPTQPFLLGPRVNSFATTPFGDPDLIKIELKH